MVLQDLIASFSTESAFLSMAAVGLSGLGFLAGSRWRKNHGAEVCADDVTNTIPTLIYVHDISKRRNVYVNGAVREMLGYEPGEFRKLGERLFETLVHPEDRVRMESMDLVAFKSSQDRLVENTYRVKQKSGEYIWVRDRQRPFKRDRNGEVIQILGVAEDVTVAKRLEDEKNRLVWVIDSSPEIFGYCNLEGQLVYVNQEGCKRGWNLEPGGIQLFIDEDHRSMLLEEAFPQAMEGRVWTGETRLRNLASGETFPAFARLFPLMDRNGRPEMIGVVITDLSDVLRIEQRLSEYKFRADLALSAGKMGVWDWNIVTNDLVWDDEMLRILGLRRDRFDGTFGAWASVLAPETKDAALVETQRALHEGRLDTTFCVLKQGGAKAWVRSVGRVVRGPEGEPVRMTGLMWDVTAEVRLRGELEASRKYFETILDNVRKPVLVKDSSRKWVYCNRAFAEMVGRDRSSLVGRSDQDIFHPESVVRFRRLDDRVFSTGAEVESEETVSFSTDEPPRVLQVHGVFHPSPDGSDYAVCVFSDVTDLKRLQEIAQQNEKQLRTFIEQLPVAVAMFDHDMKCLAASHAWLQQHGLETAPILGAGLYETLPSVPEHWQQAHLRALCGQVVRHEEDRTIMENRVEWLNWEVRPWYHRNRVGGFVVMTESVTEKRRVIEELEGTRTKQVEASRLLSIGQMAAGVAHEINNPLTVIMGKAWSVQDKVQNGRELSKESLTDAMTKISQYSERIGRIVKALRTFSRDASNDPMSQATMQEIVADTVSLCGERFRNHGVRLILDVPDEELLIKCRPTEVSQILVNLLNNAFDAVKGLDDSWVRLAIEAKDSTFEIRVNDSGFGVPQGCETRIFEPFFTTKETGKGTGLGLSISTGIAKDHGGVLALDTAISRSCFLLTLPRPQAVERSVAGVA